MDFILEENHQVLVEAHLTSLHAKLKRLEDEAHIHLPSQLPNSTEDLLKLAKELKPSNLYCTRILLLKASNALELPSHLAQWYCEHTEVALAMGPLSESLMYGEKLLEVSLEHDINCMKYTAYMLLGHVHRSAGKCDVSCMQYQEAERIAKINGLGIDSETYAFIYQQLCTYNLGRNNEALSKLLPLVDKQDISEVTQGELKQALGNIYRSAANWHEAEKYFKESISIANKLGDKIKVAERSGELGNVYRSSGLHTKALEFQQLQYEFALKRGDVAGLAAACGYIGFTYYTLRRYDSAIEYLTIRYKLAQEIGDVQGVRWCLNNIGKVYLELDRLNDALKLFSQSAKIAVELGDLLGEGTSYGNMGTACRAAGRHADAVMYHTKYCENAAKRMDMGGVAIMQNELALDLLHLGDLQGARKFAWLALHTSLEIRSFLGSQDDVLKIANHEKNQVLSYTILQYILVEQQLTDAALLVSEMGRARALLDVLHANTSAGNLSTTAINTTNLMDKNGNIENDVIIDNMKRLHHLLEYLKSDLLVYSLVDHPLLKKTKCKWIYIWLVKISGKVHFYKEYLGEVDGAEFIIDHSYLNSLQQHMGIRDVKFMHPQECVDKGLPQLPTEHTSDGRSLEGSSVRDVILQDEEQCICVAPPVDRLDQLHRKLISPIQDALLSNCGAGVPRVVIVPHSFLLNVPFAALRCPDGEYLIEKVIISVAPSIAFLSISSCMAGGILKRINGSECLVVGNPLMPDEAIFQLPGAMEEAMAIASLLECEPLCGESATKATIVSLLPRSRIIHLATHAILSDSLQDHLIGAHRDEEGDYAVRGAIVLSRSNEHCSGVLTSKEIQGMKLEAELAVLSCCKTAHGKVTDDGTLGLSRALLAAGVGCVIVTLWSIYDAATMQVMKNYYSEYKSSRDAPSALRHAMLAVIRSNPACWGAFCIIGVTPGVIQHCL